MAGKGNRPKESNVTSKDVAEVKGLLDDLEAVSEKLGEWETSFIASISEWFFEEGKPLTESQMNKLKEIHERHIK